MKKVEFIIKASCFSALCFYSLVALAQTDTIAKVDTILKMDTMVKTDAAVNADTIAKPDSIEKTDTVVKTDTIEKSDIEGALFTSQGVVLSDAQMADFKDKALRKTNALSNYISTIANKSFDDTQRDQAIDQAVKLFMDENCIVEVSSLNNTKIDRFKIRVYLRKLKALPYSKVTIEWFDIFYASNFKKRPDGKYEAVATIYQRFTGATAEGGKYEDITKKNITIIIDRVQIAVGGTYETYWDIFLGDIKVEETKKV
jgi:hypothetical protein